MVKVLGWKSRLKFKPHDYQIATVGPLRKIFNTESLKLAENVNIGLVDGAVTQTQRFLKMLLRIHLLLMVEEEQYIHL